MEIKASPSKSSKPISERMKRCAEWLVSQGAEPQCVDDAMPPLEDAEPPDDNLTIPTAVDEDSEKPWKVPHHMLRTHGLNLECDWRGCRYVTGDYDIFQRHVKTHIPQLYIVPGPNPQYKCLWDICRHQSADGREMIRHINFHAYHAKLMAIGVSTKFNMSLPACKRDSTKRNKLPVQTADYKCRWVDCTENFTAIQELFDHTHLHRSNGRCSWAGCGQHCPRYYHQHLRAHLGEKLVACPHCGVHFANNIKFKEHLQRQNISTDKFICKLCNKPQATARLLRAHTRQHVCVYACSYCDMSTQTLSALASHVRYRHLKERPFSCHLCEHTCVTKHNLQTHLKTHAKVKKEKASDDSDPENLLFKKPVRTVKKYICHMCPEGKDKVFLRGTRLTSHLVKKHGAQWPDGHVRFRYQKSEDGFYRLTTTRYESLEVSRQIMRGSKRPREPNDDNGHVKIAKKIPATIDHPALIKVKFQNSSEESDGDEEDLKVEAEVKPNIEITMCDVDEEGNVIRSEVMDSDEVVIDIPATLKVEKFDVIDDVT